MQASNPQSGLRGFLSYWSLVRSQAFKDFGVWRDVLIGIALAIATVFLQARWGLIGANDWHAYKWRWILSVAIPFVSWLVLHTVYRVLTAPWKLSESVLESHDKLASDLQVSNTQLQTGIQELRHKLEVLPRAQISIGWINTGQSAFGQPVVLRDAALRNIAQRAGHNVRIVPDKTKDFWLEQTGMIGMIAPDDAPWFPCLRAMCRGDDGKEQEVIDARNDPIRRLAAVMQFRGLLPEIYFAIEYDSSDGTERHHTTRYCMSLDHVGQPIFKFLGG
jgi:hypothetical protein